MRTLKSTFYLTLFLLGGILFSGCDEFFAALDNPVSPNLKVRKSTLTIKVGNSTSCQATASTRAKITYASSDETVATVTDFGMVTGVSVGTAYITVLATNAEGSDLFIDESAVIAVNVIEDESKEQKKGTISYATTSVGKTFGDEPFTNPLTRTGDGKVTYASSNTAVAEVNATTGEVTIKGNGETTITATVTDSKKYTYEKKTATYTLGVGTATMTVSAEGFSGTYDEKTHGITVTVTSPSGATVKYGTAEGSYTLTASPTYTNAGTYTVYYQVTKTDYTTVTGSATVEITKADMTVTAEGYTGIYDGLDHSITVTAPSGATVKYGTSADNCTETSLSYKEVGTYTIFYEVTKDNYNTVTGSATVDISLSTMTVTATGYTGTYDGDEHGITVTAPTNASVRYGETEGKYDKTSSPTYTDAGTHTVYYQVKKVGYTTVTGSATVTINKAAGSIKFTETSVTKNYGDVAFFNDTFSIIGDGVVTYTSSDTSVASVSNVSPYNGQVSILGTGTATITATVADGTNYTYAKKTAEYTLTVKPTSGTQDYNNGEPQTW